MSITLVRANGLHILSRATLSQLAENEVVGEFANGLLVTALGRSGLANDATRTLADVLYDSTPTSHPLLVALLVLDAELSAVVDDERRVLPLPGFLSYRSGLSRDRFPVNTLRLPPLNQNGHYLLTSTSAGFCLAVRLDLHPQLKVAGHVRLAVSRPDLKPVRLQATEHRLDRQVLTEELIDTAVAVPNEDLSATLSRSEQASLSEVLHGLLDD